MSPTPTEAALTAQASPTAQDRLLPLPAASARDANILRTVGPVALLGGLVIINSSALINFNKVLMSKDMFPYSIILVLLHTAFCCVCAGVLLLIKPSLFPALTDPEKKVNIDASFLMKRCLPVALFFSGQLVLSNSAYTYASVAFLQMMKESNVVLVYLLALAAQVEVFRWRQAWLLFFIVLMTMVTVEGEIHFSLVGFAIQGLSCLCESGKIIVQGVLLSGGGRKLDPLSYVLIVSPLCFAFLVAILLVHVYAVPISVIALPAWSEIVNHRWLLAANALVAFSLNVVIALFIQYSSAIAFVVMGIVKDAMIVVASAAILHEPLSTQQMIGFPAQLMLVLLWSLLKAFPAQFENGMVNGVRTFVKGDANKAEANKA
mmetsp:Transcript_52773/g.112957  ORF Transcript_52773/g.112957 Transcript_52773/m.112957 type:complete len:376 (+) Transcript_52773:109-1236(+)